MGHLSSMFNGLATSFLNKRMKKLRNDFQNSDGRETIEAMAKDATKSNLILRTSGIVSVDGSENFASVFSKRGEKGVNQDCCIIWEEFGCQESMLFCGVFDGHDPWGHFVAKRVRDSMPCSLLRHWQETLAATSLEPDFDIESDKKLLRFNIWKHSYLKTCASIDQELERNRKIDTFHSGTTALTIVRQGEFLFIANVGDSRAVLATSRDNGVLVAVQLTVDLKPNLPSETERIVQCNGRVHCLDDEPGVHRLWLPHKDSPGLAMSRAFGDYCLKHFGLISVPEVTQRRITRNDQFVVLATDGVWDVISNDEAVRIVLATPDKAKSAKRVVECAAQAWKKKRKGVAVDDITAIVLFLHASSTSCELVTPR